MSIWTGKGEYDFKEYFDNKKVVAPGPKPAIQWIKSKLSKKANVLHVGCDYGDWPKAMNNRFQSYFGVGIVQDSIKHSEQNYKTSNIGYKHIAINEWNLGKQFPIVFTVGLLQHLPVSESVVILQHIRDHLLMGGEAYLYELLIGDFSEGEADVLYRDVSKHIIPKPISILKEGVPELIWRSEGAFKHILKRRPNEIQDS